MAARVNNSAQINEKQRKLIDDFYNRRTCADILISIMSEYDISAADLARILDIDKSNITKWLAGRKIAPEYQIRICGSFGLISLQELNNAALDPRYWVILHGEEDDLKKADIDEVLEFLGLEPNYEPIYMADSLRKHSS